MKWTPGMRRRRRYDQWGNRNPRLALFLFTPLIITILLILFLYRIYIFICILFGLKPWKLP